MRFTILIVNLTEYLFWSWLNLFIITRLKTNFNKKALQIDNLSCKPFVFFILSLNFFKDCKKSKLSDAEKECNRSEAEKTVNEDVDQARGFSEDFVSIFSFWNFSCLQFSTVQN